MHTIIYIALVAVVVFIVVLAILFIMRPVSILQRDPHTGALIDAVSGGKIIAWSFVLTIVVIIVLYILLLFRHLQQRGSPDEL